MVFKTLLKYIGFSSQSNLSKEEIECAKNGHVKRTLLSKVTEFYEESKTYECNTCGIIFDESVPVYSINEFNFRGF